MQLSRTVEWALHLCLLLAQLPTQTVVPRRELSEHYDLPEAYLAKCLKRLSAAGILEARSGPHGGFRLARPADQITALEVIQAIEGTAPMFVCQEIRRHGKGAANNHECRRECAIATLMHNAEQAWRQTLSATTIDKLRGHVPTTVTARHRRILAPQQP